jgi:hypothetical protein
MSRGAQRERERARAEARDKKSGRKDTQGNVAERRGRDAQAVREKAAPPGPLRGLRKLRSSPSFLWPISVRPPHRSACAAHTFLAGVTHGNRSRAEGSRQSPAFSAPAPGRSFAGVTPWPVTPPLYISPAPLPAGSLKLAIPCSTVPSAGPRPPPRGSSVHSISAGFCGKVPWPSGDPEGSISRLPGSFCSLDYFEVQAACEATKPPERFLGNLGRMPDPRVPRASATGS